MSEDSNTTLPLTFEVAAWSLLVPIRPDDPESAIANTDGARVVVQRTSVVNPFALQAMLSGQVTGKGVSPVGAAADLADELRTMADRIDYALSLEREDS